MPTDIGYTGQREDTSTNLMFYNARFYSPLLGRFLSADTIVPEPGDPQTFNRYAYTLNNPIKYADPTGHFTQQALEAYCAEHPDTCNLIVSLSSVGEHDGGQEFFNSPQMIGQSCRHRG